MTVPLGGVPKDTEILEPPAVGATWSTGSATRQTPNRRLLTIMLAVLPIFLLGIIGAVWIVSRGGGDPAPASSSTVASSAASAGRNVPTPQTNPGSNDDNGQQPADQGDAGPGSMQNGPDAGRFTKPRNKKKEDVLGF